MSDGSSPDADRRDVPGDAGAAALLERAREALRHAYAPYSGLAVGAALESASGRTYTGVNVENAAYGSTICAERAALVKAVSEGERAFRRIAIASSAGVPHPCGACRQMLAEFGLDLEIVVQDETGARVRPLHELLPDAFHLPSRGRGPAPGAE
ncbi:MAG: cytidine deaminase [Gemmatimonadota bacterium]